MGGDRPLAGYEPPNRVDPPTPGQGEPEQEPGVTEEKPLWLDDFSKQIGQVLRTCVL